MSPCLEFEGKSVDKAVEIACAELKIPKEQLKYDIISYGSSGIFGLVAVKKAKIKVVLKEKPVTAKKEKGKKPYREKTYAAKKSESTDKRDKTTVPKDDAEIAAVPENDAERVVVPEDDAEIVAIPEDDTEIVAVPEDDTEIVAIFENDAEIVAVPEDDVEKVAVPENNTEKIAVPEATLELGKTALRKMLDFITTDTEILVEEDHEKVLFDVRGGNSAVLIGKRGQTLEAIQYLLEKIMNKNSETRIRVQVDIEGYLDNRQNRLKGLASRLATKAIRTGKPVTVGQLNSHDRRIIHLSLRNDNTVRTQSMGDGPFRKLVIFPKKNQKRRRPQKDTQTAD